MMYGARTGSAGRREIAACIICCGGARPAAAYPGPRRGHMQAILFYLDVIAFLVVVYWIYGVELRSKSAGKGLLGMREAESAGVAAPMQPTSRWRQVEAPTGKPAAPERL